MHSHLAVRGREREDADADPICADAVTFASLPLPLARLIFLALPVDARGRASCVCRAWRDALADPSLWSRLDMTVVSVARQCFPSFLDGAARRARGQLRLLDLSNQRVTPNVLLPVLTANAGSLRELHLHTLCSVGNAHFPAFQAVVAAAPLLQALTAEDVRCFWQEAPRMLRAEPPFAPLQVFGLTVNFWSDGVFGGMERVGPFAAALADASLQPALLRLRVRYSLTVGALVDAALARRLRELSLEHCTAPAAAPLARLLAEGSLALFEIQTLSGDAPLFDVAGAALVAGALRMNTTLTKLVLYCARLCVDARVAELLLEALVGHPTLRELKVSGEYIIAGNGSTVGAALAALIAADAPALQVLDCPCNRLGDVGLAPIVDALALNHHLRTLDVYLNFMSEAFARERLLPAVRANATLRKLTCFSPGTYSCGPSGREAEELVRRRGQPD